MADKKKPTSVIGQCKHCRRAIGARTHFKFVVRRWWHEVWCGVN